MQMDHDRFMRAALAEAQAALAKGEFPVGCVLVHDNRVIAAGSRIGTAGSGQNEVDHAEMTALRNLSARYPDSRPAPLTAFCTMEPCLMCLGALVLNGVTDIVYAFEDVMGGAANCRLEEVGPLYRSQPLSIRPRVLREESLKLFKAFFAQPANRYWRDSPLARYTLAQ